ncbi:MAG: glycosyltransferase [Acidobacteria bacterium]|nr:glycosyltransferase [Acidobacteriota bacterium]
MIFRETTDPLVVAAWLCFAVWPAALVWTIYCLARQTRLRKSVSVVPAKQNLVSILVPARNEAHRILRMSLGSLVAQDHANFEIIVLNDRSTDSTESILEELSQDSGSNNFRFINGSETPEGWLGKPHALKQAFEAAKGDWVLMTDADIIFDQSAIRTAVAYAERFDLDALSLLPRQRLGSFWEQIFIPVFAWFCLLVRPLHRVNDPRGTASLGSGNFFLLKREAIDAVGGFEAFKDDVAEDLKLAQLLKSKGVRYRIAYAPDLFETRMYSGFRQVWEGFSKNFYSGMSFSITRTLVGGLWILVLGVLPFFLAAGALSAGEFSLFFPLFAAYLLQVILFLVVRVYFEANPIHALLAPVGLALFLMILLNSARKILDGSGVVWKGRKIYEAGGISPPRG